MQKAVVKFKLTQCMILNYYSHISINRLSRSVGGYAIALLYPFLQ